MSNSRTALGCAFLAISLAFLPSCNNNDWKLKYGNSAENIAMLEEGFLNPEQEYRPQVWWHWMNGQVSLDGIRKDLLWMHSIGISNIHCFDAGFSNIPHIVEPRRPYMSEGWKEAFNYALSLADSLGIEATISSSPGWSITGGPWVSEDDAQKKLVWSESIVEGGRHFRDTLLPPPSCSGPYQYELQYPKDPDRYSYYKDVCVIAMKLPSKENAGIVKAKEKAGFIIDYQMNDYDITPEVANPCREEDVVDLSDKYTEGLLDWEVPEGKWKIFRFGYNLLGRVNGPTVPEACGLEADKLDSGAMRRYYSNYLQLYKDAVGEKLGKDGVIKNFLIDSYEAGKGTWTPRMEEEFEKRRGYSLRPWMPVLTGQIIGSAQRSEQFLFDWRQTLGELIVENHYDLVNEVLAEYGMKRFSEAHEERRAFVGDGMLTKKGADMPMAAFWVRAHAGWYDNFTGCESDLKEASSVAHVYGQNICGAESFTTNGRRGKWDGYWAYQCHPGFLKRYADASMAMGLNRFVIHSSVHQPSDDHIPGLSLGIYGQWFNRHDTWAEEAKVWLDYLARSSYMLSQGRYVADIAYLYGEDTNPSARFYTTENEAPSGYNYDYVNAEILQDVLKVKGGKLIAESGAEYSVVMIDTAIHKMSIGLVRTLDRISSKGVMICGNRPQRCASLGYDAEFESLCDKIWSRSNVRRPQDLILSLKDAGKSEDAILGRDSLSFVHRKMKWGEIYWVANISSQPCEVEVSLNVEGYEPEIWNATDCSREKVSYSIEGGRTKILLNMERDDAQFIVLAKKTKCKSANYNKLEQTTLKEISGEWALSFPSERGAPKHIYCDSLINLSQSEQEGVKYYSGSIIYSTEFSIDSLPETAAIDLGRVHNMARVYLNGQDLGLAWKEPYRLNCSKSLKLGVNTLEIKVINSWANRLIGDARSPVNATKYSFTSETYYATEDPLPASGLLGPVRLIEIKEHK